jgi:hypothetical protein
VIIFAIDVKYVKCRERLSAGMESNRKFTGETQTTLYCDVTGNVA